MNLQVLEIDYADSVFIKYGPGWAAPSPVQLEFKVFRISTAPPGKHDLGHCEGYERQWRKVAPLVFSALRKQLGGFLSWAIGPMEQGELPRLISHVIDADLRFHIPEVTYDGQPGYVTTWLSFEYQDELFRQLMEDRAVDLEYASISSIALSQDRMNEVFAMPFHQIGAEWVLDTRSIAIAPLSHFEGCYLFGETKTLTNALRAIDELKCAFEDIE